MKKTDKNKILLVLLAAVGLGAFQALVLNKAKKG